MDDKPEQNNPAGSVMNAEDRGPRPTPSEGRLFEIHVKGHLNSNWSDWLEGLDITLLDNGEMILSGVVADQAALMGILDKLNRLNLTLRSVNEVRKKTIRK
jgi:hypothetical protein